MDEYRNQYSRVQLDAAPAKGHAVQNAKRRAELASETNADLLNAIKAVGRSSFNP